MAEAIRELAAEPDYAALRRRAHAVAAEHFAWAPIADVWAGLLRG